MLEQQLLAPGDRVLVAVSGGLDSMVLLHLLGGMAGAWPLAVAHFNHQLRGRSSDADERLVGNTARKLGLKFRAGRADVARQATQQGISIEMAAREQRHRFLARTARRLGLNKIALAHHADDQVELFFLRLLRGTGPEGLSGMAWTAPSPADPSITLIRPLLTSARSEIQCYARQHQVVFREDASNRCCEHERNRIRHELLPLLRAKFQPGLSANVLRLMNLIRAESDFVGEAVRQLQEQPSIDFAQAPLALQRRWLRSECFRLGVAPDFDLVERLRMASGQEITVQPRVVLARDANGRVHRRVLSSSRFQPERTPVELSRLEGHATFSHGTVAWKIEPRRGAIPGRTKGAGASEMFDADRVGPRVILRHWQPGDRYQPIGMKAPVKLQDLFTNLKIPAGRRRKLALAETANGEIFWIEGLRIAETFKVTDQTARCLEWCWRGKDASAHEFSNSQFVRRGAGL